MLMRKVDGRAGSKLRAVTRIQRVLRAGQAGSGAGIAYLDIDLDGIRQTSEAIASAASARAGRAAGLSDRAKSSRYMHL